MILGGLIGPIGRLQQVPFTTAEPMTQGSRQVVKRAMSGRHAVQVLPRAARSWACEIAHDAPNEGRVVEEMALRWAEERQTLVWYPADAQGVNMLDPDASHMSTRLWTDLGGRNGGQVQPNDGRFNYAFSAYTKPDGSWAHLSNIPVPRSRTVSASVVVSAEAGRSAHFWVDELAADGTTTLVHKVDTAGSLQRLAHTFVTAPTTVALTFGVSRAVMVTQPALTLTDQVMPWAPGRGCWSALIELTERDHLWVGNGPGDYWAADSTKFTVTEVIPRRRSMTE